MALATASAFWLAAVALVMAVRAMQRSGVSGYYPLAGGMFAALLILIALRMPVGLAMLLCGNVGYVQIVGWAPTSPTSRPRLISCSRTARSR